MSPHRKAFLIWLTIMVSFVAVASTLGPHLDPVDDAGGAMEQLIEAAAAHATTLRKDGNAAEAERWERLAAAAKVEARRFIR
jgi:hypothetical protein